MGFGAIVGDLFGTPLSTVQRFLGDLFGTPLETTGGFRDFWEGGHSLLDTRHTAMSKYGNNFDYSYTQ